MLHFSKPVILCALMIILFIPLQAKVYQDSFLPESEFFQQIRSGKLLVYFSYNPEEFEKNALLQSLEKAVNYLDVLFSNHTFTIIVKVFKSADELKRFSGFETKVGGVYTNGEIFLQPITSLIKMSVLDKIVLHECAHMYIERASSGKMPGILNEGFSAMLSNIVDGDPFDIPSWEYIQQYNSLFFIPTSVISDLILAGKKFFYYLNNQYSTVQIALFIDNYEANEMLFKDEYSQFYYEYSVKIRVLLTIRSAEVTFFSERGLDITHSETAAFEESIVKPKQSEQESNQTKDHFIRFVQQDNKVYMLVSGEKIGIEGYILIHAANNSIGCNDKTYRGDILVAKEGFVNIVPVEYYLYSVVTDEMPVIQMEALKVQAIMSRTLAYYYKIQNKSRYYDISALADNQVYRSLELNSKGIKVVNDTYSSILIYDNALIKPYFFSTCAGSTDDSHEIWNIYAPYFKPVKCKLNTFLCSMSPHFTTWITELKKYDISTVLGKDVKDLFLSRISSQGRAVEVSITYTDGEISVLGFEVFKSKIGKALGWNILKSNMIEITQTEKSFIIKGKGLGHGIGICQWGTIGLASKGYNYQQIIDFYTDSVDILPVSAFSKGLTIFVE